MPTKKGKKTKSKKGLLVEASPIREQSKEVSIRKAKNGYVVSSYGNDGNTTLIAKTKMEAKKHASKLLNI